MCLLFRADMWCGFRLYVELPHHLGFCLFPPNNLVLNCCFLHEQGTWCSTWPCRTCWAQSYFCLPFPSKWTCSVYHLLWAQLGSQSLCWTHTSRGEGNHSVTFQPCLLQGLTLLLCWIPFLGFLESFNKLGHWHSSPFCLECAPLPFTSSADLRPAHSAHFQWSCASWNLS